MSAHEAAMAEVAKGPQLKHVDVNDKSAPVIDGDVKLREAPHKKVFEEVTKEHSLKAVDAKEKHDASAPKISSDVKIGEAPQKAVLTEVQAAVAHREVKKEITAAGVELKHVETKDSAAPKIDADVKLREAPQKAVFADVTKEHTLKHVDAKDKHDASAPKVEATAHVGEAPQKAVLSEVQAAVAHKEVKKEIAAGGAQLKHVETKDSAAPKIEADVKLREAPQKAVFADVTKEHSLKKVEAKDKHDASAPKVEATAHVGEAPQKAVLTEVQAAVALKEVKREVAAGSAQLKHVETKDSAAPKIEADVKLREAPQKAVFADVTKEHALKKVDDKDKHDASAPKVEATAHVGENPLKAVLSEVQAAAALKEVKKEIAQDHHLKHVETKDSAAPKIDASVKLREAPQKAVFAEVAKDHTLKHVDDKDKHDASAPKVDADLKLREAPQKAVFAEVTKEHALKPVEKK